MNVEICLNWPSICLCCLQPIGLTTYDRSSQGSRSRTWEHPGVVHGVIVSGVSSLTADDKSVFTEYELEVRDTLWVKQAHQPRLPVVIIRPGGTMKLPEGLVTTIYDQVSPLHLGREYILFLRAPKTPTNAYYLNDAQHPGVLEIDPGSISLTKRTPEMRVAYWFKQTSLEALVNSSVWSADKSEWCANMRVTPR